MLRIIERLAPLVKPRALILWGMFLYAWSVLAEVHLAEFVYRSGGEIVDLVHAHPYWLLLSSIAGIVIIAIWPEIRHLMPSLPDTLDERVYAMEHTHLPSIAEKLKALEDCHHGAEKEHGVAYVMGAHARDKVNAFGGAAIETGRLVPDRTWIQITLFDLMRENGDITTDFTRLRDTYGWNSAPALAPFSKWRPQTLAQIPDDLTKEWERWARRLEAHRQQCYFFGARYGTEIDGGELFTRIGNWGDSTTHGDIVKEMLNKHGAILKKMRDNHATSWATSVEERFTKS